MSLRLLGAILDAQGLPREAPEGPRTSQNEAKTWKNQCLEASRFLAGFLIDFLVIFYRFPRGFLSQKIIETQQKRF